MKEEIGFDIQPNKEDVVEHPWPNGNISKLYIIPNVPEETQFECSKEVKVGQLDDDQSNVEMRKRREYIDLCLNIREREEVCLVSVDERESFKGGYIEFE